MLERIFIVLYMLAAGWLLLWFFQDLTLAGKAIIGGLPLMIVFALNFILMGFKNPFDL